MKPTYLFAAIWCLLFTFCGCKKEADADVAANDLWTCHHKTTWDSAAISTQLIGKWEWEYIRFSDTPENSNGTQFKGVELEFNADGTLMVWNNGTLAQNTSWEIRRKDGLLFEVVTLDDIGISAGRILFCEDKVEFNNSYLDGSDNFFRRK